MWVMCSGALPRPAALCAHPQFPSGHRLLACWVGTPPAWEAREVRSSAPVRPLLSVRCLVTAPRRTRSPAL
ncbi:hypothetical protein SGPA1_20014 [Streptomyces misionensis JCM 4497]